MSIVGFVFIGLMLVFVLFAGSMMSSYSSSSPLSAALSSGRIYQVVLMLAMAVLYFFPCLFMFNFSNKMLQALRNNEQPTLVASFRQLKLCYKYIGILTLIVLSIYALALVVAIFSAATK